MPTPTFEPGQQVHNVRPASQYCGHVGRILERVPSADGFRYNVQWPDGECMLYRPNSLIPACQPEASFKVSDSGMRTVPGVGKRRRQVHRIPSSTRTPITEILSA